MYPLAVMQAMNSPQFRPTMARAMPPPPMFTGPSQEEIDSADEWFDSWAENSYQYGREGKARRDLFRNLYRQRLLFSQWKTGGTINTADEITATKDKSKWRADFVTSITPVVQSFANRGHAAIFSSDRPFFVSPEDPTGSIEDDDFPTSEKLELLLSQKLEQGGWITRLYEALQDFVIFPAAFGKIYYYEKNIPRRVVNPWTLQQTYHDVPAYACPILESVDCDHILVDPDAKDSDVQRWHGIGQRVDMPFHRVVERFRQGVFHLNGEQVARRWNDSGGGWGARQEGWRDDHRRLGQESNKNTILTLWEYHGLVANPNGSYSEGLISKLTDRQAESPGSGVLVRLQKKPALDCGIRPFVSAQFTPLAGGGAFGMSALEPHMDIIYYLSQLYNLFIDCVRIGASPTICAPPTSELFTRAAGGSGGEKWHPGKVLPSYTKGDIWTLDIRLPELPALIQLIQHFERMLETRTGVSDATLGVSNREKTATEAHGLFEALSVPLRTRLQMFQSSFLDPALNVALAMLQQFAIGTQRITYRGKDGYDYPVMITPQEMSTGKYRVRSTMDREDQTRIAKAQSIERVIPLLSNPNVQAALQQEGMTVSLSGLIESYLKYLSIDDIKQIIKRAPMPMAPPGLPPGAPGMPPGLPPGGQPPTGMPPNGRPPLRLVEKGGPMGDMQTDPNAFAQLLQLMQAGQAPNQEPRQ